MVFAGFGVPGRWIDYSLLCVRFQGLGFRGLRFKEPPSDLSLSSVCRLEAPIGGLQ